MESILLKGIKQCKPAKKESQESSYKIIGTQLKLLTSFDSLFLKNHPTIKTPFLVQQLAIPYFFNNISVIVNSFTGSGKTIAFLVPLIEISKKRNIKPVIIAPTCMLVAQIKHNIEILTDIRFDVLLPEEYTPGNETHLVIDEADSVLENMPDICDQFKGEHLSLFSATINKKIEDLFISRKLTKIFVQTSQKINHKFVFGIEGDLKASTLVQCIDDGIEAPCLIFVNDQKEASKLEKLIANSKMCGYDESYEHIQHSINEFRLKKIWYLIVPDIFSRGMDFKNIKSVINYDFPTRKTNFVHRIGRVNRNVNNQQIITIFTKRDFKRLRVVASVLKEMRCEIPQNIINIMKNVKNNKKIKLNAK
ncbi:DEAD-box ATP-dependent RNA helicase 57 [Astathelohania contejeani]|uniref:ATP-dependent RNA helicase n=1 Tax=Astathelohania contejeani TaxID=164912 RepID=A0ABQ7I1Z5_9MICR|nr:DEAD-box ATP-dependent RNA helicase 57 [Thelohania contejeani]